ncbi:YciI family protein [Microbulbifer yueqingensis]|uniref:Uncharacterized conserved protein n=1 Tax=Microbulbifer yueqingensis TaxID=658219 RepID=A0A1G9ALS9_9GAMM|nr:YciI family protein [Microbulbifer yueqingensis]SDK27485.1 Uncharacterized conserved protein [Microbulbifer yueqingensis]
MKFMLLMIPQGYGQAGPGVMPDPERVASMMEYNRSMEEAGILVSVEGLHPRSMGARVAFAAGEPQVIDGPLIEAGESLGGFWMIQVSSLAEAIDWARRCPAAATETIEVRRVQEVEDFPEDVPQLVTGAES